MLLIYLAGTLAFLRSSLLAELDHQITDHLDFAEHMLRRTPSGEIIWAGEPPRIDPDHAWRMTARGVDGDTLLSLGDPIDGPSVRGRTRSISVDGLPVTIEIMKSEGLIHRRLLDALYVMLLGLPLGMGVAAVIGFAFAGRALAPVATMAARARTINAESLSDRLPVERSGGELAELAWIFNEMFARIERSFDQLRRFTAVASHELRTPLASIRATGEVLLREPRSAEAYRDAVGSMLEDADRMTQLVEGLLMLSRADAGQIVLTRSALDLRELAATVVDDLAALAEDRRQRLTVHGDGRVVVSADRLILRQALTNLVHNAIKYSADEGAIEIRVTVDDGHGVIDVADDGPGIAPEDQARIFERFYRTDRVRSRQTGGTGLGLSIVRWAVEAHGGDIEVHSAVGQGARFRVKIPSAGEQ